MREINSDGEIKLRDETFLRESFYEKLLVARDLS
jgi:hypothetical protein